MLEFRTTTVPSLGISPAEALMNRVLRTKIPIRDSNLTSRVQASLHNRLKQNQNRYKKWHDRRGNRQANQYNENENVVVQDKKTWKPGIIVNKDISPRSYWIMTDTGNIIRRNETHIRKSYNEPLIQRPLNYMEKDFSMEGERENEEVQNPNNTNNMALRRSNRVTHKPSRLNDFVMY